METQNLNIKKIKITLHGVYKAEDCMDLQDVKYGIEHVNNLIRLANINNCPTKALYKRLLSLEKKAKKF